jgi:hypothetical protein
MAVDARPKAPRRPLRLHPARESHGASGRGDPTWLVDLRQEAPGPDALRRTGHRVRLAGKRDRLLGRLPVAKPRSPPRPSFSASWCGSGHADQPQHRTDGGCPGRFHRGEIKFERGVVRRSTPRRWNLVRAGQPRHRPPARSGRARGVGTGGGRDGAAGAGRHLLLRPRRCRRSNLAVAAGPWRR